MISCPSCLAASDDGAPACGACGQPLGLGPGALGVGSMVANRYEVRELLGRGGMGVVYKAYDRLLEETVALKLLRDEVASPDLTRRFREEIRLARRVSHRNVCRIHEYGEDGARRYISMAFIDGVDLKRILREQGPLRPSEALDTGQAVASGLHAIHEEGIVHRDLKTANIMRDRKGVVRLMDFGIAKDWSAGASSGLTVTGMIMGTPEYMSPEQATGTRIDLRSDIYALGVVMYELFTAQVPFRGETPMATLLQHIREPLRLDTAEAARIPESVRPVLARALAKTPEERFASAKEMGEALAGVERAAARGATASLAVAVPDVPFVVPTPAATPVPAVTRVAAPTPLPAATPVPGPTRRVALEPPRLLKPTSEHRRALRLGAPAGAMVLAGLAAAVILKTKPAPPSTPSALLTPSASTAPLSTTGIAATSSAVNPSPGEPAPVRSLPAPPTTIARAGSPMARAGSPAPPPAAPPVTRPPPSAPAVRPAASVPPNPTPPSASGDAAAAAAEAAWIELRRTVDDPARADAERATALRRFITEAASSPHRAEAQGLLDRLEDDARRRLLAPLDATSLGRLRRATYVAGTLPGVAEHSEGSISFPDKERMVFLLGGSRFMVVPYKGLAGIEYGLTDHIRGLVLKKKSHYVSLTYQDAAGDRQGMVLELGADDFRPVLTMLEARSGRKVQYQDEKAARERWK